MQELTNLFSECIMHVARAMGIIANKVSFAREIIVPKVNVTDV